MNRLTFNNDGVAQFTHEGMIMYCSSMAMADCVYELESRLAAYNDAKERGELVSVVRCKDCKFWSKEDGYCRIHDNYVMNDDSFCSEAAIKQKGDKVDNEQRG